MTTQSRFLNKAWWKAYAKCTLHNFGFATTLTVPYFILIVRLLVSNKLPVDYPDIITSHLIAAAGATAMLNFVVTVVEMDAKALNEFARKFRPLDNPFRFYLWLIPKGIIMVAIWAVSEIFNRVFASKRLAMMTS